MNTPQPIQLKPDDIFKHSHYKLQIRDIFAMYNHEWDVLGEVIQNAIDSVIKRREITDNPSYQPEINIEYDLVKESISIRDNGLGIPPEDLKKVVAPHYSGKSPQDTNRGEFGIGLAFVAFSSNQFKLSSCFEGKLTTLQIQNGYAWVLGEEEEIDLTIDQTEAVCDEDTFTEISVKPARFPIFSTKKLIHILRRYTAIGDYWAAYNDEDGQIKVVLDYVETDGKTEKNDVLNRLWHPADAFDRIGRETVDYLRAKEIHEAPRDQAMPNIMGRGLVKKDKVVKDGREFAYYALICRSSIYEEIAEKEEIKDTTQVDDIDEEEEDILLVEPEIDIYPGIFACKKGMPLGTDIPRPQRSGTSIWAAFYITIHSDTLKTEPGRKKLSMKDERLIQSIARNVIKDMEKLSYLVIARVNPDTKQEAIIRALEENCTEMRKWKESNPLNNSLLGIQASVEPINEQTLIGLFHEMIGADILKGYKVVKLSTYDTYDGLYDYSISENEIGQQAFSDWLSTLSAPDRRRYSNNEVLHQKLIVVEFKLKLETVIRDFLSRSKYHTSIKLLVAWDVNESKIKNSGWNLQKLPPAEIRYYGAKYVLRPSSEGQSRGIMSTHVLLVKRFIDEFARQRRRIRPRGLR